MQEEQAALNATCDPARRRHEELATAYRLKLNPKGSRTVSGNHDWSDTFLNRLGLDGAAERAALQSGFTGMRTYRRGQIVADQADQNDPLHLVIKGWAARFQTLEDGSRQITDFILPGELCDLSRMGQGAADIAVALTPLRVALLDRGAMRRAMGEYPKLAEALMQLAFDEEAILRTWVVCLGRREKREHTAHLLCELHERLRRAGLVYDHEFDMPLTQEELADALGMTAVHTNRVLQSLRKDGLISTERHHLRLLQLDRLKKIGEFD